jgi:hypothetical protein
MMNGKGWSPPPQPPKTPDREPTMIVVNNSFERRYFYSAAQAARGLGWMIWPSLARKHSELTPGEVQVYRLDVEATDTLNAAIHQEDKALGRAKADDKTRNARFKAIIHNITGIKEGPKR